MNNLENNKVLNFATVMQKKLDKNSHKGGWENCSYSYLLKRIKQEIKEIEDSIKNNKDSEDVINECADVANFSMMMADNYEQE